MIGQALDFASVPRQTNGRVGDEGRAAQSPDPAPASPESPPEIAERWLNEGPLVRVATGFSTLDDACRGGLPVPWRVYIVGAPSAGKTGLLMTMLLRFATGRLACGILAVDEEPDDLNVRVAQMVAGATVEQCESRDKEVLVSVKEALSEFPDIYFYGGHHTIESAAEDLAKRAGATGKRAVLGIDSIQTARCVATATALRSPSPREVVEANVAAVRTAATNHRVLVIATSEANRGSYRNNDAIESGNDMAAGKESSGIEFSAQTLLVLRTPRGYPNNVHVRVPKNRRGARSDFEFFLRLDRERHAFTECANPADGDDAHEAQEHEAKRRRAGRASVERDARAIAQVIRRSPGLGEVELRAAVRMAGTIIGVEKLKAAMMVLREGFEGERLVDHGKGKACQWGLERLPGTTEVGGTG